MFDPYLWPRMRNSSRSTASPCPDLPDDILARIFQRTSIVDRVRMKLVCKNWKRVVSQDFVLTAPEAPWLVVYHYDVMGDNLLYEEIGFESLLDRTIYRFKLPDHLQYRDEKTTKLGTCWYCGSSRGWVLVAVGPKSNLELFLWNPLSGSTRKLPPLTSLPFYDGKTMEISFRTRDFCRMQVFPLESSSSWIVAVIFNQKLGRRSNHLAVCTTEDHEWTLIGSNTNDNGIERDKFEYMDLLFNTIDRKLYVLVYHVSSQEGVNYFRANSTERIHVSMGSHEIQVHQIIMRRPNNPIHDPLEFVPPRAFVTLRNANIAGYLVESSDGTVMIAFALMNCLVVSNLFISRDERHFVRRAILSDQTTEWTVDLPPTSDIDYGQKLKTIGDGAIFVGGGSSFCMHAAASVPGLEADCIYFATDHAKGSEKTTTEGYSHTSFYNIHEQGVFYLQQHRVQRTCATPIHPGMGNTVHWFTPKIFMY